MQIQWDRLRGLILVVAVLGVVAAAINTKVGAYFLGGLLAVLVIVALTRWLTTPEKPSDTVDQ